MRKLIKENKRLKAKLVINQSNDTLSISGYLNNSDYTVNELYLISRNKLVSVEFPKDDTELSNEFAYDIDLNKLYSQLYLNESKVYDWFLRVERDYDQLGEQALSKEDLEVKEVNGVKKAFYYIRLGRFVDTEVNNMANLSVEDGSIFNYITQKGNISCIIDEEYKIDFKNQIERINKRKNKIYIEGKIFSKSLTVESANILLRARGSNEYFEIKDIQLIADKPMTRKKFGLNRYQYKASIEFNKINDGKVLEEDIYDFFMDVKFSNYHKEHIERIGNPTFRAKHFLGELEHSDVNHTAVINPYYTFKKFNLSLEVNKYPKETFKYLKRILKYSSIIKFMNRKKDIWIVGERPHKAQDTGLAFFKHVRNQYPNKEVYYVIESDSPDLVNLNNDNNILFFKSKEHINKVISASKIISSHHADYLYPTRTAKFKKKVKATKVFIQHGVMGIKNMVSNYGKKALNFDTDLFMVSSDFEKDMIVNDFGYDQDKVFVTGLSRFDELFNDDIEVQRDILIIPTWRDWISTEKDFLESDYYLTYKSLIESERLFELKSKFNFEVQFCLHPNMEKYSKHFNSDYVNIINMESKNVQKLIQSSCMMITDYSSVSFDFSFLKKPLVYFQYDRNRFIGRLRSHLDLDNDLPGEIEFDLDGVLSQVEFYAKNNFQVKQEFIDKSNKFLKYRDRNSSQRIYNVIEQYVPMDSSKQQIVESPLMIDLFKKFRKSKPYFPLMKLFYRIGKYVIPVDRNLILFESGLGKQYADSPKMIYEEIVKRGIKYKKVWVYNKKHRFNDPNTLTITRLSPAYYYYLIRAGYWINNQNFPHYIRKRKATKYLQTWHGTPLKKMLFDIENVQGRAEGYTERIGRAVKDWDYLLSPSHYATKSFRSAFHYEGKVLEKGYPRNDILVNPSKEIFDNVKNILKIPEGKKVILYAPTFRDNMTSGNNKFTFDLNLDLEKMYQELGTEFILLLRMHVVVKNKLTIPPEYENFVMDVSKYPDAQDLLLISDILITDYSSMMFDFANTKRPILFYTFDLHEYRDDIRGFYMDFEKEAPGPLLFDTDQIIDSITNLDNVKLDYRERYKSFINNYCYLDDGKSSKRIVDELLGSDQN